jgi:hypothetical protein
VKFLVSQQIAALEGNSPPQQNNQPFVCLFDFFSMPMAGSGAWFENVYVEAIVAKGSHPPLGTWNFAVRHAMLGIGS